MQIAVVLAGGIGTRMYPASAPERPKQFLSFADDDDSLLGQTVDRVSPIVDQVCVLTRPAYADDVRSHAPDATVLTEPMGKDTGPALVYGTHELKSAGENPVLFCLPSDQHVGEGFQAVAQQAMAVAERTDQLVTLGIEPTRAAIEYGYIKPGADHGDHLAVEGFYEKPDPGAAARYVYNDFYWNAGMFAWTPETLLSAVRSTPLSSLVEALEANDPLAGFDSVDPVSIDHAVLEQTEEIAVIPAAIEWDDLGSWDSLGRILDTDADGTVSSGDVLSIETENCVLACDSSMEINAVGVSDLVVAAFDDRVLVVPTNDTQRVREVVEKRTASTRET